MTASYAEPRRTGNQPWRGRRARALKEPPTPKQLRYILALADEIGWGAPVVRNKWQASVSIAHLEKRRDKGKAQPNSQKDWQQFRKRLARFGYPTYNAYLRSEQWAEAKRRYAAERPLRCFVCGGAPVDIHHRSYRHLCREPVFDLMALCRHCHGEAHQIHSAEQETLWLAAHELRARRQVQAA